MTRPPRRHLLRAVLGLVVVAALLAAAAVAVGHEPVSLGPGDVDQPADDRTVVSVQGFHFQGHGTEKKPARLVAAEPGGDLAWRHEGGEDAHWFYDVDPLENGNLLVTSTVPGDTVVFEYDPDDDERVWERRFDAADTHDVDRLDEHEIVVANMREYDADADRSDDRVFVYNLTSDEVVWEWTVREHFPADTDGGMSEDWTHLNDVDPVDGGDAFLLSPRNFDQVVVVDRDTREITMRLGTDDRHDVLYEQHNPDLIRDEAGRPTILVADSENDRVVEYRYEGPDAAEAIETPVAENEGEWNRTWAVTGFNWPRDADRLPNGNTLVTDTLHHRVVEVTPAGEIVWEFYAPWAPYDAERPATGDESNGPAIADQGATGTHEVAGGAGKGPAGRDSPGATVAAATEGWPFEGTIHHFAQRYDHVEPFVRPVWMPEWSFAYLALAALAAVPWGLGELVYQRRRVHRGVRAAGRRLATAVVRVADRLQ